MLTILSFNAFTAIDTKASLAKLLIKLSVHVYISCLWKFLSISLSQYLSLFYFILKTKHSDYKIESKKINNIAHALPKSHYFKKILIHENICKIKLI